MYAPILILSAYLRFVIYLMNVYGTLLKLVYFHMFPKKKEQYLFKVSTQSQICDRDKWEARDPLWLHFYSQSTQGIVQSIFLKSSPAYSFFINWKTNDVGVINCLFALTADVFTEGCWVPHKGREDQSRYVACMFPCCLTEYF